MTMGVEKEVRFLYKSFFFKPEKSYLILEYQSELSELKLMVHLKVKIEIEKQIAIKLIWRTIKFIAISYNLFPPIYNTRDSYSALQLL